MRRDKGCNDRSGRTGTGSFRSASSCRRAREAKGMSLDDVASRTRIPIRHLQNIEREEWDALPAVTYAIGFTRNYANAVGLDGAALARELRERDRRPDPPRRRARILCPGRSGAGAAEIAGGDRGRRRRRADRRLSALAPHARSRNRRRSRSPRRRAAQPPAPPAAPTPQAAAGQPVTLVGDRRGLAAGHRRAGRPVLYMGSMAAGDRYQLPATARHPLIRTGRPQNLRALLGTRDLGPLVPRRSR